jgi:hypothetical protein
MDRERLVAAGRAVETGARRRPRWLSALSLSAGLQVVLLVMTQPLSAAREGTPATAEAPRVMATFTLPDIPLASLQNEALPERPIADDRGVMLGDIIGSDLWHGPDDAENEFWAITDRGPTGEIEVDGEEHRTFPVPEFTPFILHVRGDDGELEILEAIPIVTPQGEPVTGISNLAGTDEEPFDFTGNESLGYNQSGLDVEGLVQTSDGGFWLAEEYRPSLVKVDADGRVIARYVPEGVALPNAGYPVEATLPAIYGLRQNNRGFEGLALSGDGKTLFAVLQSPLSNPDDKAGEASRSGRILAVDTASGRPVAEYVYALEDAAAFDPALGDGDQNEVKLSGLVWLDESTLLVLERTDEVARLYRVDLNEATDILGSEWDDPATSPSLESLDDPVAADVQPLPKTLAIDLAAIPDMPDKIEGVAIVDDDTIAVSNDIDFAFGDFNEAGRLQRTGDQSYLLVIDAPIAAP